MRKAVFCLSVMLCFAALAVSAGCGKESVRGYTGEQITSISIYWQEPADFYAPDGVALICSEGELESFKEICEEGRLLGGYGSAGFEETLGGYDSSFFEQGELIVLFIDQPSPCNDSEVADISAEKGTVEIDVNLIPPGGEGDCPGVMMQDIHFIELPKNFCGERELHVNYIRIDK